MPEQLSETVKVLDKDLTCRVCDNETFLHRRVEVSAGTALPAAELSKHTASCFICEKCGYIHWFFPLNKRR